MKILVSLKRVVDYNVRIRVRADGTGVETQGVKHSINPFDEIALEEALSLKDSGIATEVVVVAIGAPSSAEVLRAGLAMGADRAILVQHDQEVAPMTAAQLLAAITREEAPDLVLCGKQAIDDDANQLGQMLAGLLGWPQATCASKFELEQDRASAVVTREVDGGLLRQRVMLPAVITADLRLNQPRHASLPNIMKAKSKPLTERVADSLGVDLRPRVRVLSITEPAKRARGINVKTAEEVISFLREKAGVL